VARLDERLLSVLTTLDECRAALIADGSRDTAQLISMAILELRMKLNRVSNVELKVLCDEMLLEDVPLDRSRQAMSDSKSPGNQRRRPLLRLVK